MNFMSVSSAQLIQVASSNEVWNGVTVSDKGRIFVCYPRIEGESGIRIAELINGQAIPFPNTTWNNWKPGIPPDGHFVRTNSIRIGPDGNLWIVDTGTPKMGEKAIPGAAKLVSIDLTTNQVVRTISLDPVMKGDSFIDDLRIYNQTIYLTDAGSAALVIMDLKTGKGRRVLENRSSTTDQIPIKAEGKIMRIGDGQLVLIHADQLEVSPDGKYLYFQPASGPLYRVELEFLNDSSLNDAELESHVSKWFDTPSTGGTCIDAEGNLYVSDVNHSSIIKISPDGKSELVIKDSRLLWGDALWIDHDGYLWIPVGQLNRLGAFQKGHSIVQPPLFIYKIKINAKPFKS
ncbi:L-dopachrome tautomerase-related protein [Mucilaginibacter sp. SG564]|uniref:L-dopachrome tautomerase-related protein n=1 Tax=Mucilaginibacter sp. SG564 TaxID=2587022 RepID=UPI001C12C246|nr:L-dopachrome tautomerase-related protein [Mucilaginibacter sp. SG564]NOW95930.1 sugar lactone lactonase YvrE [Mucilaginibacter sp. SG564]